MDSRRASQVFARCGGAVAGALLLALMAGCGPRAPAPAGKLLVLCGSSMAGTVQDLAREFTARHGVEVEFDLGGSETLLPKILAGAPADVFVCHDPFEAKVEAVHRRSGAATVGYLQPVLLVKPGNPAAIRSLEDLGRSGVRIGMGDPRYSTCGAMFVAALEQRGVRDRVMPQVVLQARSPSDAATGLVVGSLDVAVVWNYSAVLYSGKVEVVNFAVDYPDVRVTVIGLEPCPHPEWRDAFLRWCERPESLRLFRERGYGRASVPVSQ